MAEQSNNPWCHDCGLCCMHTRTPPFLADEKDARWHALPQALRDEIDYWTGGNNPRFDFMAEKELSGLNPCIWLDLVTGKCRHYDLRPDICRDYQVGNPYCRTARGVVGLTVEGMPVAEG